MTITLSGTFTPDTYDLSDTAKTSLIYAVSASETYTAATTSTDCSLILTTEKAGTFKCTGLMLGSDNSKTINMATGVLQSK